MSTPARHSIERGDVVLSNLPPYGTQPWLSMGVVLHAALLARAGIRARVVRPIDPPFIVPRAVALASDLTFALDPSIEERLAAMERAYRETPSFFDGIVTELLAGGESVVGLSLFRNNADVSFFVARLVKERSPSTLVVLGGPEVIEEPETACLDWVDAVVGADAESVIVDLFRALLDRDPTRARNLRNVWVAPAHAGASPSDPRTREPSAPPEVSYLVDAPLLRLLVGDREPTLPILLNWGCPYGCSFCSNKTMYSRFEQGSVERVLTDMDAAVSAWRALHPGRAGVPALNLQFSDATTNALPSQLDELLRGVVARQPRWGMKPFLRGQTLVDSRVTRERADLMREAGFGNTFFGLDGATDEARRLVHKPGSVAQVERALAIYREAGLAGVNIGFPVGLPTETDAAFDASLAFLDRALSLDRTVEAVTALPFVWFQSAQDPSFVAQNHGARRGVLWRTAGPAGDPATRARRLMRLFDHVAERASVVSPIAPYVALPAMWPEGATEIEAWMRRHARAFDQLTPVKDKLLAERVPDLGSPVLDQATAAVRAMSSEPFHLEGLAPRAQGGFVAVFVREGERVAIQVELSNPARRVFARAGAVDVSYLKSWQGLPCIFDEALVRRCVDALARGTVPPT
ncbi:MAG: radical SAM protein [Polyangiaceae bacterium]